MGEKTECLTDSFNIVPQTSSSQEVVLLWVPPVISGLIAAPSVPGAPIWLFDRPTRLAKSRPELEGFSSLPLAAMPDRSSCRCESRRNWLCSRSTRSPSFLMTDMKRWNCPTLSTEMNVRTELNGGNNWLRTYEAQLTSTIIGAKLKSLQLLCRL